MAQVIAARLNQLREARHLTQAQLAHLAGVSARTISRLENGEFSPRRAAIEQLAKALGVHPQVLTGEKSMPADIGRDSATDADASYQLNVRVDAAIRNAFELVAKRYGVSVSTIVEFAPLFFEITAAVSLKHRRAKLAELKSAFDKVGELDRNFPHFPPTVFFEFDPDQAISAEERSIEHRDLFGSQVPHGEATVTTGPDGQLIYSLWCEDTENPFLSFLGTMIAGTDAAIEALGPNWTSYEICREEAMELAGGDQEITRWILEGQVPIQRMPRGLGTAAERIEWMRQNRLEPVNAEDIAI